MVFGPIITVDIKYTILVTVKFTYRTVSIINFVSCIIKTGFQYAVVVIYCYHILFKPFKMKY